MVDYITLQRCERYYNLVVDAIFKFSAKSNQFLVGRPCSLRRKRKVSNVSRRYKISLLKPFFEVLSDGKPHTFHEIAKKIGTNWETVKNLAKLLEFTQEQPRILVITNKISMVMLEESEGQ